jgi:uncharacterized protein (DUF58 family)
MLTRSQSSPYGPLLDALRGVVWPARRTATAALPGTHPSRLRGSAPELSEYRPYRQGDDPRRLDWKLLARSDRAYVRLAEDRSVRTTVILVDATASMAYPAESLGKWRRAKELAVGLAAVAQRSGDPAGIVAVAGGGVVRVRARARRDVVAEIARALDAIAPKGSASLAPALAGLSPSVRLAVVSDFLGDVPEGVDASAAPLVRSAREIAAAGGEVHAIHVVADEELAIPDSAALVVDPEDDTVRRPLSPAAGIEYARRFAAWRGALADAWVGDGLTYSMVTTGESAARAVRRVALASRSAEHAEPRT